MDDARDESSAVPVRVSHYKILEKIGQGGMGEVFLAEDQRLRRRVALKVLPKDLTSDADRRRRFVTEARAAASIEHPHIAAVYDIGEFEGRTFIAMEYVRGRSLRQLIKSGELRVERALSLAIGVAEALVKVHERGVVHRDLKPENILISEDGYPKIIDFGLAKLVEPLWTETSAGETEIGGPSNTRAGEVMGTVAYMSPEQTRGETIDARSDVFSFGVLFFEMLAGEAPFKRRTVAETLSAILHDPVPPLTGEALKARNDFERLFGRALAKNRDARHQSMKEVVADLKQAIEKVAAATSAPPATGTAPPRWVYAAAATLLSVAALFVVIRRSGTSRVVTPEPISVLVGDFENRTGDAVFDGALEQALSIGLEGASFITSFARPEARRQAAQLDSAAGNRLNERMTQLVCRSAGVKAAVVGVIEPRGEGYRISVRAFDPVTSNTVAEASTSTRSKGQVLQAADVLASELRAKLGDTAERVGKGLEAETFTTASLEAMNAYAKGQELVGAGKWDEAMTEYKKAVDADPNFGRAYSGMAVVMRNLRQPGEARRYFELALARIDGMTDREKYRTRGAYYVFVKNYPKAIEEYTHLVDQFPADAVGYSNLALSHFYDRDFERAVELGRRGIEIDPKNVPRRNNVALYALYAGDFETAAREARAVIDLNTSYVKGYVALALAELASGHADRSTETYRRLEKVSARGASMAATGLADIATYEGRLTDAASILERAVAFDVENKLSAEAAEKHVAFASAALARGKRVAARGAADEALKLNRSETVVYAASRIYLAADQAGKATRLAEELAAQLGDEAQLYAKLITGETRLAAGDLRGAIGAFHEAQKVADSWLGRFALGRAYLAAGAYAEAHSELEVCLRRRGEATAVFLDDVPTYGVFPQIYYYLGRAQEGLKSSAASESYRTLLSIQENGDDRPMLQEARRRLDALMRHAAAPSSRLK